MEPTEKLKTAIIIFIFILKNNSQYIASLTTEINKAGSHEFGTFKRKRTPTMMFDF